MENNIVLYCCLPWLVVFGTIWLGGWVYIIAKEIKRAREAK